MPDKLSIQHGEKYGRWTIFKEVPRRGRSSRHFICRCDCGTERIVSLSHLRMGKSKSCGCFRRERTSEVRSTHGMSRTRLFSIWNDMVRRCSDKSRKSYKDYGGRGISICDEWLDFKTFMEWALENGYQQNLTIERMDNDGDYCAGNCTWIPKERQSTNTRINRLITYDGKTQCIAVWARELNIAYTTIISRFNKGLGPKECLSPARR